MVHNQYIFKVRCIKSERDEDQRYNLELIHGIQPQTMQLCGLQLYEGKNSYF